MNIDYFVIDLLRFGFFRALQHLYLAVLGFTGSSTSRQYGQTRNTSEFQAAVLSVFVLTGITMAHAISSARTPESHFHSDIVGNGFRSCPGQPDSSIALGACNSALLLPLCV